VDPWGRELARSRASRHSRPSEVILVGIPVRLSGTCYDPNGWTGTNVFYVKEQFLTFTQ
jgi:hypothetical protein